MILLISDRESIAVEFAILCDNYQRDYSQLTSMYDIAFTLVSVTHCATLAHAYRVLCGKLVLIQRYDEEFFFASKALYEALAVIDIVEWAE